MTRTVSLSVYLLDFQTSGQLPSHKSRLRADRLNDYWLPWASDEDDQAA